MTQDFKYIGTELDLFGLAENWKRYWAARLKPDIGRRVLEVGTGIGKNIPFLWNDDIVQWVALEPDAGMIADMQRIQESGQFPAAVTFTQGTIEVIQAEPTFDTILYIDVLEHIEHDAAEVEQAAARLLPGGKLIVLGPAYNYLFTPFDQEIGHFRRYTTASLRALTPASLRLVRAFHLDSVGLLASLGNKLLLQSKMPTRQQIHTWDRLMVPLSRALDPITGYRFGRSAVIVWEKPS